MRKMDWRMAVLFCAALCCMLLAAVFSIEGPGEFWPGKGLWGRGGFLLGSLFYMSGVLGGAVCASREARMPLFSELLQCLLLSTYAFLAFWREQSFAALLTAAGSTALCAGQCRRRDAWQWLPLLWAVVLSVQSYVQFLYGGAG